MHTLPFFSISTADGYEQITIMANEKVLPSLISLVNECSSLANASRYFRIIRVEKVQSISLQSTKHFL